ncbi:MAG: glycerol-3-phosphate dehydrogenase/oxidase [Bacteroidetes bacterium]|nr:glycerol-3-phosphate dehydrogenase/oxidase [Bacteroidota bacterium]
MAFSLSSRPSLLSDLLTRQFDMLVIGGGITGCGIALDAALRGMKVALVEKADFASGTSSRSTKLIHGGLRYLKQFELKLVHDVGSERAVVYRNARHVVIPEKMLLPIIKNGSLGRGSTSMALRVYDFLAGVKKEELRKMLSREETLREEPLLNTDKVIAGGLYYEYRTDDSRLVIELAKSAVSNGAICLNYVAVTGPLYDEQKLICGAKVTDQLTGQSFDIKATKVVNAAGPFVDLVRKSDESLYGKRLQLTKGVHIVFPYEKLPLHHAAYFDVKDGRMIFAIPRNGVTYVGTTDTVYNQNIDSPHPTKDDVQYLIDAVNAMFPTVNLKIADVVSSWAGLRPLIYEDGKSPSELSRKDEIIISPSGLISIAGGKLTGYRLMAEKIAELVSKELLAKVRFKKTSTKEYQLSGGEFASDEDLKAFAKRITTDPYYTWLPVDIRERWVYRYGRNTEAILRNAEELKATYADPEQLALAAEITYSYYNEMVTSELDFVIRRTGMIYFDKARLDKQLEFISSYFSHVLSRTPEQKEKAWKEFSTAVAEVTEFK